MDTITRESVILSSAPHFGNRRFKAAFDKNLNFSDIIAQPNKFKEQLVLRQETIQYLNENKYDDYLNEISKWLKEPNHNIVSYLDDNYPDSLKQIVDPPILLYCVGDTNLLTSNQLAVVGSRNYSTYGRNVTDKIITELANSSLTITS